MYKRGKIPLGRPRSGWEDNIKVSVNVMGDAEPIDTFQNALLPCEGGGGYGAGSDRRETYDVRHLKKKTCSVE